MRVIKTVRVILKPRKEAKLVKEYRVDPDFKYIGDCMDGVIFEKREELKLAKGETVDKGQL